MNCSHKSNKITINEVLRVIEELNDEQKFLEEKYKLLHNEKHHPCSNESLSEIVSEEDAFCNKNKYIENKCRAITNLRKELFITDLHQMLSELNNDARKRIIK